jgi:membrane fusion protein, heavy metal efflux system
VRIIAISAVVIGSAFLVSCLFDRPPAPAEAAAQVGTGTVKIDNALASQLGIKIEPAALRTFGSPVSAPGKLQINQDASWQVGALTDGKILTVLARVGDKVKTGQVLAVVHSHDVHDARAKYRQAVAELQRQKALAEQATTVRDRTRRLFDLRAASREQLDAAETAYQSARTGIISAQAEVEKAKIHLVDFLDVPIEIQSPPDHASPSDSLTIKAPAAGTVIRRNATPGTVVSAGDPVFTIANLASLWMIAAVNETDMARVHQGQRVEISVLAFPERKFAGRVLQLGEGFNPQTRTLQVRVLIPNPQELLKPEMFARADFALDSTRQALQVAESALQELNGKQVVFLREPGGSYLPREVKIGSRSNGAVEILSGLETGDPVVVQGGYLLKSQLMKGAAE